MDWPSADDRRQVHDRVDVLQCRVGERHVAHEELDILCACCRFSVDLIFERIQDADVVAAFEQAGHEMAADEPETACYESFHMFKQ